MTFLEQIRAMVATMPPGSAISLPVDWLRAELEKDGDSAPRGVEGAVLDDLTLAQVADKVKRSESTVRTWCGAGLLPGAYKLMGKTWMVPPASLRAMLDKQAEAKPDIAPGRRKGKAKLSDWRKHAPPAA